jgi:hypothetical protein
LRVTLRIEHDAAREVEIGVLFLARKDDGMPGIKVLWRGFQRLEIFTAAWIAAHPRPEVGKG